MKRHNHDVLRHRNPPAVASIAETNIFQGIEQTLYPKAYLCGRCYPMHADVEDESRVRIFSNGPILRGDSPSFSNAPN